jgi:hypothetical protein
VSKSIIVTIYQKFGFKTVEPFIKDLSP